MFKGRSHPAHTEAPTPVADASEEALLEAAAQYDEAALGELYDRYEAKIFNYIYRRTGDESLAEDLTSQVFLKMLEAIRDQKAWRSSFFWLALSNRTQSRDRSLSTERETGNGGY